MSLFYELCMTLLRLLLKNSLELMIPCLKAGAGIHNVMLAVCGSLVLSLHPAPPF